jgi:4'-phosphopantetheinyl transferase
MPLEGDTSTVETYLSTDECKRADRFHFARDREAYILARGTLRSLLGRYLGRDPAKVRFIYGAQGKPSLSDGDVQFNLSHTRGLALLALARGRPVGVDVEEVRPFSEVENLPQRIFSMQELQTFRDLKPSYHQTAFFNAWTRKEAVVKATGLGFTMDVREVEVTFAPEEDARLLHWNGSPPADQWTLRALEVPNGYAAALAVPGTVRELVLNSWSA